ncbi:MAG: hypothetical protein O9318_13235 [Hylemonella sp.]|uniref:hypothetical protein n=1 Tax=Hylemonella sp. TaxID=2066020 RepID=UPI0022CA51FB|nr:hypothetical protein [Hylemonella sp.]MCZ8253429.1 hypothetical protein [Hylemonella sp.]
MAEQLLNYRNLNASHKQRSLRILQTVDADAVDVDAIKAEGYRRFILERRVPAPEPTNHVLVDWLNERKDSPIGL